MKNIEDCSPEITTIIAGLLASGHYTYKNSAGEPGVAEFRFDSEWKKDGLRSPKIIHAVEDAVAIWVDLQAELKERATLDAEKESDPGNQNTTP